MTSPLISTNTPPQEIPQELGLAGLVEKQLKRYLRADTHVLPGKGLYERIMQEVERPLLRQLLHLTKGNQLKAAHMLGLNRNTLRQKLQQHGLSAEALKPTKPQRIIPSRQFNNNNNEPTT